jgi:hypothetical protein
LVGVFLHRLRSPSRRQPSTASTKPVQGRGRCHSPMIAASIAEASPTYCMPRPIVPPMDWAGHGVQLRHTT